MRKYLLFQSFLVLFLASLILTKTIKYTPFDEFIDNNIKLKPNGFHGFQPVSSHRGNEAFYWFVESVKKIPDAPLFIVIPNGSGKSVLNGYFTSWGQQILRKNDDTLSENHYSINKYADLLMIDIPIGSGFSRFSDISQIPITIEQKKNQFHTFLNNFFDKNPKLRSKEIYQVSEQRGTQMTPIYAYQMALSDYKLKGIISFANQSNPWIDKLSYLENLEYKRVVTKRKKMYIKVKKMSNLCNLFSILGSPSAENYCYQLTKYSNRLVTNVYIGDDTFPKIDPDTHMNKTEIRIEKWLNTERVKKYFRIPKEQRFFGVNPFVFKQVSQSNNRIVATDALLSALQNRDIEVIYITGSLGRTSNWIGNLMSATRQKWVGQDEFGKSKWAIWNRKNDFKEFGPLKFTRIFGKNFEFWQGNSTEYVQFINEYILKNMKNRKDMETKNARHMNMMKFEDSVKDMDKISNDIERKQKELIEKTNEIIKD